MTDKTLEIRVDEAVAAEKVSSRLVDDLVTFRDEGVEKLRQLAEGLTEFLYALERSADEGEQWRDADGADKRDAREMFLEALDDLNGAFSTVSEVCDPEALLAYCDEHAAEWTKEQP